MSYGNNRRHNGPGPVPERWLKCPRKSIKLSQDKFLIFKTPLSQKFDSQVAEQYRFPVSFVFQSMKSYKVSVGLWIDLTNTSRFYSKEEVEAHDCHYVKLQCKGRGETPSKEQTSAFVKICDGFIKDHPLKIIGIHCTHGFNRSGFMLVSYMVEKLDWELGAALQEFAMSRPPGIYKKDYIDELYRRYDDVDDAPEAPPLPDWCYDNEKEDTDGEDGGEEEPQNLKRKADDVDGEGGPARKNKRRQEIVKLNPQFMDGVSGVRALEPPLLGTIQREVQDYCEWKKSGFPGSQPVSMTLENMQLLEKKPYRVSWKADGVRYMMYIKNKDEVYCIDRDNCVFQVFNLTFRYRKNLQSYLKDTLLDGEMVMDKVNGQNLPRFLVYDIITLLGYPMLKEPFFPKRYEAIKLDIVEPRNDAIRKGLIFKQKEPFSVRLKEFLDVRDAGKFLDEKFSRKLCHEPDGLIFQPSLEPYVSGRCDDVLKWKPASLNSVDFRLKITRESGMGIVPRKIGELYVGGFDNKFGVIASVRDIQHLDNKIVECTYSNGKWHFLRERTDKSFPNAFSTAQAVCDSIKHPVTKEILLDFIERNRYKDSMPPPSGLPPRYHNSRH